MSFFCIHQFEVPVKLGCDIQEREFPQTVSFDLTIEFPLSSSAESSDQLADAIDYVVICEQIRETAYKKCYNLIEHLCFEATTDLFEKVFLRNSNPVVKGSKLIVKVTKLQVPVVGLKNGVSWTCLKQL